MEWGWILAAVFTSLTVAASSEANRLFKLDGFRLNFWRTLFTIILVAPCLMMVETWPRDPMFYLVGMLAGTTVVVGMTVQFNLCAAHNGRVANLFRPVQTFSMYVIWLAVDAGARENFVTRPLASLGVLAMFALAAYALSFMRRNDASWRAFLLVAPVGLLYAISDIFGRLALEGGVASSGNTLDAIVVMAFILFSTSTLLSGAILMARYASNQQLTYAPKFVYSTRLAKYVPNKPLCPPNMIKASLILAVLTFMKVGAFYYGLLMAPNPAFLSAVMMIGPIWLMIYHKLYNIPDEANPWAGLFLVVSAIGLVLLSQGLG